MVEILEKRTLNSKTFLKEDGKFVLETYRRPIHYVEADGSLQDAETELREDVDTFFTEKTLYPISIKKLFGSNRLITATNKNGTQPETYYYTPHSLIWLNKNTLDRVTIATASPVTGVLNGNKVTYSDAFGSGIDFEITNTQTGFRKEIVLHNANFLASRPSAQHFPVFITKIETTSKVYRRIAGTKEGQELLTELQTNPYVKVTEQDGFVLGEETETFIKHASIIDSSTAIKGQKIRQFLAKIGTNIFHGKVLPIPFLNTATFPVRSDATIDGTINQDNWLDANQPTFNWNGSLSFFRVGDQGGADGARGIARFTMPSNPGSATITDVAITFRAASNPTSGHPISVYHGTNTACTSWTESGSTWNTYDGSNNWTAAGAASDFSSTIVDTYTTTGSENGSDVTWYLYGSNATNPITVTWDDVVNVLLRNNDAYAGLQLDLVKDEGSPAGKITVTYTVVSSAIKTVNGLAYASVKTVNGLAVASVKTIKGLA